MRDRLMASGFRLGMLWLNEEGNLWRCAPRFMRFHDALVTMGLHLKAWTANCLGYLVLRDCRCTACCRVLLLRCWWKELALRERMRMTWMDRLMGLRGLRLSLKSLYYRARFFWRNAGWFLV